MPHPLSRLFPRLLLMITGLTLIGADVSSGQPAPPTAGASTYSTAPFGTVHLFRPAADPRGVVLFLSDSNGVSTTETSIATTLAHRGLLVALVSTPVLMATPDAWSKRCLNANYPLVDLSNDVQHRAGVKAYMKPVILGTGEGGTLAYASLAQWPNGSYQGVVSVGFSPQIASGRPWCTAPGFSAEHVQEGTAWRFGPNKRTRLPWIALSAPGSGGPALAALTAAVPHARAAALPGDRAQWPAPVADAVVSLLPRPALPAQAGMLPVPDMPLTLVPARKTTANRDVMAIIYSGDGGWAGIDRDVAGQLANAGIPVVGVDSLSYFWTARTPAGAARDLRQLILSFSQHWKRPRVLLVGYSFGADALPLMVDALDGPARARIARMSLLGLSATADFQFHLSSWLDISSDNGLPTVPAVTRLRGLPMQCVRGEDESDSACPQIPAGLAQQFLVPGGHHFDRNAPLLTQIVLGARHPGTISD
ncbi:MAG: virulence factor family protein [Sphingomonas sp.]|nr:virulence factor family protein [Sphingomonas sp.]